MTGVSEGGPQVPGPIYVIFQTNWDTEKYERLPRLELNQERGRGGGVLCRDFITYHQGIIIWIIT